MATDWREQVEGIPGPAVGAPIGPDDPLNPEEHDDVVERVVEISASDRPADTMTLPHGRRVAKLVRLAKQFESDIRLSASGNGWANAKRSQGSENAKSIFGLTRLSNCLEPGTTIYLRATGSDAEAAVAQLGDALEWRRHGF